ncbi:hypothetical protein GJ496_006326 [Pomphorhynchus laevis]|nr:hypothetical protein GJ496_006326 [Pomphorhynchus laevis]
MSIVHRSFEQFLLQHFNPTEMDATLLRYQKIPHWLMTLISVPCWRNLILKLADSYPQCGLLRFAIRATLECGIEHCIHSLSVSTQDVHVCLKMVSYFVKQLMIKPNMHGMEETLRSIGRITSISECTYVITLLFLRRMQELSKTASVLASCMKRLIFEIEQQTLACQLDVVAFGLALRGTIMFPDVYDSLTTIIAKGAAESVELTLLNRFYEASLEKNSSNCCDFMRHPVLIDVLLKLLFCINMKMRLTNEDKIKAVSILSHSISIRFYNSEDTLLNPNSERSNKNDISEIRDAISEAIGICENFCSERLQVFQLIKLSRYPIIAAGLIFFLRSLVLESEFQKIDESFSFLFVIDEIAASHSLLIARVFDTMRTFLEIPNPSSTMISLKQYILNRMIYMLCYGHAQQVLEYVLSIQKQELLNADLLKPFTLEILEIVDFPMEQWFEDLLSNLVLSGIFDQSNLTKYEQHIVNRFIRHCKTK